MCSINKPMLKNIKSGDTIVVTGNPFSIGRGLSSDYVIVSRVISRKHCVLEKNEEGWVLLDNSTNGTFVNDKLFKGTRSNILCHNDILVLVQDYEYKFLTKPEENDITSANKLNNAECSKKDCKTSESEERQIEVDTNKSEPSDSNRFDADVKAHSSTCGEDNLDVSDKFDSKEISDEQLCRALEDVLQRVEVNGPQNNSVSSSSANENANVLSNAGPGVTKNNYDADVSKGEKVKTRELLSDVSNIVDLNDSQRNSLLHSISSISENKSIIPDDKTLSKPKNKNTRADDRTSATVVNVERSSEFVVPTSLGGVSHLRGDHVQPSATSKIILNQQNTQGIVNSTDASNSKAVVSPQNENKRVKIDTNDNVPSVGTLQVNAAGTGGIVGAPTGVSCGTVLTPQTSRVTQMTFTQASPTVVQFPSSSSGTTKSYIRIQLTPEQIKRLQNKGQIITLPSNFVLNPNMIPNGTNVNVSGLAGGTSASTNATVASPVTSVLPNIGNMSNCVILNPTSTVSTVTPVSAFNNTGTTSLNISVLSRAPTSTVTSSIAALASDTRTSTSSMPTSTVSTGFDTDMVIDPNTVTDVPLGVAREVTIPYDGGAFNSGESSTSSSDSTSLLGTPKNGGKKGRSKRKSATPNKVHTSQEATCSNQTENDLKKCDSKLNDDVNNTEEMEDELQCSICSELFVKAVTLTCSHTFCKYCIDTWKRNRSECPICRKAITNVHRTLVLDNVIEKIIEKSSKDVQQQRKALLEDRQKLENPPPPPPPPPEVRNTARRGRDSRNRNGRRNRNDRNNGRNNSNQSNNRHGRSSEQNSSNIRNNHNNLGATTAPPRAVSEEVTASSVSEVVTISSESSADSPEEFYDGWEDDYMNDYYYDIPLLDIHGLMFPRYNGRRGAYYGGYGSCYRCGDPGHWANGCPYR